MVHSTVSELKIVDSLEIPSSPGRIRMQKSELGPGHGRATGLNGEQGLGKPQSLVQRRPPLGRFNGSLLCVFREPKKTKTLKYYFFIFIYSINIQIHSYLKDSNDAEKEKGPLTYFLAL